MVSDSLIYSLVFPLLEIGQGCKKIGSLMEKQGIRILVLARSLIALQVSSSLSRFLEVGSLISEARIISLHYLPQRDDELQRRTLMNVKVFRIFCRAMRKTVNIMTVNEVCHAWCCRVLSIKHETLMQASESCRLDSNMHRHCIFLSSATETTSWSLS